MILCWLISVLLMTHGWMTRSMDGWIDILFILQKEITSHNFTLCNSLLLNSAACEYVNLVFHHSVSIRRVWSCIVNRFFPVHFQKPWLHTLYTTSLLHKYISGHNVNIYGECNNIQDYRSESLKQNLNEMFSFLYPVENVFSLLNLLPPCYEEEVSIYMSGSLIYLILSALISTEIQNHLKYVYANKLYKSKI